MANMAKGIAGLVAATIGVMMLVMVFVITPMVGYQMDESIEIPGDAAATNTITFTGTGVAGELVNLSNEQYTMNTTQGTGFEVVIGGNATVSMTNLVAEINTNSTLFTATSSAGVGTLTLATEGDFGNAVNASTDVTGGSVGAALFSGGVTAGNWHSDGNADLPMGYDLWTDLSGIIAVAALVMIVAGIFTSFKALKESD